jgi:hypothetical protein
VRLVLIALLASGCVLGEDGTGPEGGDPGDDGAGSASGGRTIRPVPTNGLVFDANLAAQLPTTALGTRADHAITLAPATASALAAPAGHALLKYVAICALPAEDELVVGADRFPGYYGLAPAWVTQSCDADCQHWISACLLAHANEDGHSFPISLRGDHPALSPSPDAAAAFTYQEAGYYGNVFQRQLYACWGTSWDQASTNDAQRILSGRVCGTIYGDCGFVATGPCLDDPALTACERPAPAGGGYADCHTGELGEYPRTSPTVHEVVTVYLQP